MENLAVIRKRNKGAVLRKLRLFGSGRWILGSLLPLLIVVVWQYVSSRSIVDVLLFPAPSTIVQSFIEMIRSGELYRHMEISMKRTLLGFLLGGSLGLLIGAIVGLFRYAEDVLDPIMQMVRTIPMLALTPLFILWFGLGEMSKVLLIALGSFFPLYVNTFLGVRNVDARLFDVALVLEFSRYKQFTKLILPAAMSNILLGIRLSLSISWVLLVVAELMGASRGVGFLIQDARTFVRTDVVFIGIFLFAAFGKVSDSLVRILERRLLKWQDTYKG